jgi:hypothetical protein
MTDELASTQIYTEHNVEDVIQPGVFPFENVELFLSSATASTWPYDGFSLDPDYLASQEVL